MAKKKEAFSFDKSVAELEKILADMQSSEITSVDEMVKQVDKAMSLYEQCKEELGIIKKKIDDRIG